MYKWARVRTASRNCAFYRTLLFLFTISVCRAVLVNRTIDSNFGDPVTGFVPIYQPQDYWSDQTCVSCPVKPDKAKAFDGTWRSSVYGRANITLQFTGVAVWVFFILYNPENIPAGASLSDYSTHANITLDQQYAGTFSYVANLTSSDPMVYNATIFSTSGLADTSHELIIGTYDYPQGNRLIFDWAIYTGDDSALSSLSTSSSTATTFKFPSTIDSSSVSSTSPPSPAPLPQGSSSKTGIIVGCTLGVLAVIALVLVFLVRRLRRAPPVRNRKVEGILDIDVPPRHQPYRKREIPVSDHEPTQSKAARLREARQRELDERIQSAQHELDNLRALRNARFADEIGDPSAAGPLRPSPELASLRNEMQQLNDQVDYLEAQRESDWALGLSNEPLPPAYTQQSNNLQ